MKKLLAAALLALALANVAHAEPVTVYGLTLGAPLPVEKCDPYPKTAPCWQQMGMQKVDPRNGNLIVAFPVSQAPEMPSGGSVAAWVVDGLVQRVTWWTTGVALQEKHLRALEAKFGPGQVEQKRAVTRMGVEFPVIEATWALPDGVTVSFTGSFDRADRGRVEVSTPMGEEVFRRAMEKIGSGGTKL